MANMQPTNGHGSPAAAFSMEPTPILTSYPFQEGRGLNNHSTIETITDVTHDNTTFLATFQTSKGTVFIMGGVLSIEMARAMILERVLSSREYMNKLHTAIIVSRNALCARGRELEEVREQAIAYAEEGSYDWALMRRSAHYLNKILDRIEEKKAKLAKVMEAEDMFSGMAARHNSSILHTLLMWNLYLVGESNTEPI